MRVTRLFLLSGVLSAMMLVGGCGGSSGGGVAKATISSDNYKDLAVASAEGAKRAVTDDNKDFSGLFKAGNNSSFKASIEQARQATETTSCIISGTFTFQNFNEFATTEGEFFAGASIVFDNCDNGDGVINGTISNISFTTTDTTETSSFTATNLSVAFEDISNFSGSVTCTYTFATDNEVCTTSGGSSGSNSGFVGSLDDREYSISGMAVEENTDGSFDVNGDVIDPVHGSITVAIEGITFNCSGGQPGTGSVTITGAEGATATITFTDCTSFSVSLGDGSASDIFQWADIL